MTASSDETKVRRAVKTDALITMAQLSFGAGGVGGVWLFVKEAAYAGSHPGSELAGVLQIVGLVLLALSIGGLFTVTFVKRLQARVGSA